MKTTQIEYARSGVITPQMKQVSRTEDIAEDDVLRRVLNGNLVIMTRDNGSQTAIGNGASTKVNVNLGTSSASIDPDAETEKARVAEKYGADTITDLSMGGDIRSIRKTIFDNTSIPLTTVPIYQSVVENGIENITADDILTTLEDHVHEGVSSVVLHCVERKMLESLRGSGRIMGMVSKGGSFTSAFMLENECENPFIDNFDHVLDILKERDVVLSLGNTMRSGCVYDNPDPAQMMEIETNISLAHRANQEGVQVIVEGLGGHLSASQIPLHVSSYKSRSPFPLFVAGPLPTDIAPGYDHISGAVGASIASGAGADYMCYITPSEHLSLPNPQQVREGLIAFKIAAHIGDSIKYGASTKDLQLARRRAVFDWEGQMEYALDPDRPREMCPKTGPCSMCGEYCAIKIMGDYLSSKG
ncbi:thiamine biosynthesis protein ThiC [Methanosalsum zhilinae DSM 4017]|uniref:Thiamine biosynthesis protein ThiC n=1 Tax=Methanosalsum zhilinae (strain DSM 4017 / NBRC 107636 / OCM 62 / WeN5) TaxID=679901 RepID=F7XMT0_METZD|nr:phosphomethylpyrimidine synthase ThiC [Methanosalsum zhilinae]AEH59947.1 thiamine biosynthesis protein ThiC [Methanosalsum zhilinae DSM 4017]